MKTMAMSEGAGAKVDLMPRPEVTLRTFRAEDAAAFRALNEDWITKHFGLEAKDRETLGDPEGHIVRLGGQIYMAFVEEEPVGCCALMLVRPGVYEVAKMTVAEGYRGFGIGRKLLAHTIGQGRAMGAASLYLETNSGLADAIHLYEELGFVHLPPQRVVPSPYARADVFMELVF